METLILFCSKYKTRIHSKLLKEKNCLRPKREYTNSNGERIQIFCPCLMSLSISGEKIPFYQKLNQVNEEKDRVTVSIENVEKLKESGQRLVKEGIFK